MGASAREVYYLESESDDVADGETLDGRVLDVLEPGLSVDETIRLDGLDRPREVIPLRVFAPKRKKVRRLFDRFDAFCDDIHPEGVSQRDDALDHLQSTSVFASNPPDEGAIHLEGTDLQPVEMTER